MLFNMNSEAQVACLEGPTFLQRNYIQQGMHFIPACSSDLEDPSFREIHIINKGVCI